MAPAAWAAAASTKVAVKPPVRSMRNPERRTDGLHDREGEGDEPEGPRHVEPSRERLEVVLDAGRDRGRKSAGEHPEDGR